MAHKGEEGSKMTKKLFTWFMNGPLTCTKTLFCIITINVYCIIRKLNHPTIKILRCPKCIDPKKEYHLGVGNILLILSNLVIADTK